MDHRRFDFLARTLADTPNRRGLLGGVLAMLAALLASPVNFVLAKKKKKPKGCKGSEKQCGSKCIPKKDCCRNGDCKGNQTCQGGKCKCAAGTRECAGTCIADSACCANSDCGACDSCLNGACVSGCQAGQSCVDGTCTCSGASCSGCCDGTNCRAGDSGTFCGSDGVVCFACGLDQPCDSGQCAACDPSGETCSANGECCTGICTCGSTTVCQPSVFFQGFEENTDGWINNGPPGTALTRVPSGTHGIEAKSGNWYGEVATGVDLCPTPPGSCTVGTTAFTRWGGYANVFPQDGFVTEIDVYLDPAAAIAAAAVAPYQPSVWQVRESHFSYAVAFNGPAVCAFLGSVVMHAGASCLGETGNDCSFCLSTTTPPAGYGPGGDPCSAGNYPNFGEFSGPAGWYTFRHAFQNNGGNVRVTMEVLNAQGNPVALSNGTVNQARWTYDQDLVSGHAGTIGVTEVGGNRYGWFPIQELPFLAIDNTTRTT